MNSVDIANVFRELSTPLLADALVRLGLPLRVAPREIRPFVGRRLAGWALPAAHAGSVDVFLEAIDDSKAGDVLVIDNGGRTDEACIGALVGIEAKTERLGGVVVWGMHRDSDELAAIGLPVFSCGACPNGPLRARDRDPEALVRARLGWQLIERSDVVFGDADGVLFVNGEHVREVLESGRDLACRERQHAALVRDGRPLRQQFRLDEFVKRRAGDPAHTFRQHLRAIGGAIEE